MVDVNWHQKTVEAIWSMLKSDAMGLSTDDAQQRLSKYGPNILTEKKQHSPVQVFLAQFKDLMIGILAAAAVISGLIGELTDAGIIIVIIILNAMIGFIQEYRAEKAIAALKKVSVAHANVLRDGHYVHIPSEALVPGDVVMLEAGNIIPADIRLIESHSLKVDESSLTGESVPVEKNTHIVQDPQASLGDRTCLAFKGTLITHGRAKGIVFATGMQTEFGRIADLLQLPDQTTPLQQRMIRFSKLLTVIVLIICAVIFTVGVLRNEDPIAMLLVAISLAVAAIPEALPALITIALALGAKRLVYKHALIRRLPAVETLGAVSFICSDKTGTLTTNRMHVEEGHDADAPVEDAPFTAFALGLALNHDVRITNDNQLSGDPTEIALVEYVRQRIGADQFQHIRGQFPRVAELPFDSDRKAMTSIHRYQGKYLVLTKGAPECIAAMMHHPDQRSVIETLNTEWSAKGMRVMAYAFAVLPNFPDIVHPDQIEQNLHFAGMTGMIDPPRAEAREAIQACREAGIIPVMITGDHPATAKYIATELGILGSADRIMTGTQLQATPAEVLEKDIERIRVYARVSPEQKLRILQSLQKKGHFIAMTGDGVNDAPSLRAANIGVAMGINGTDVTKEVADMILLDDNFATIVRAVKEGRRIYDNVRKFVKYIMTCNGAELWTIMAATLAGLPIPLLPIHILWINLVTDGLPGLALANEKADRDTMQRPPRKSTESIFADGLGAHIIVIGILMALITLGTQWWCLHNDNPHWQTMVFTVLSLSQLGHVIAIRSERNYLFRQGLFSNTPMVYTIAITVALQIAILYIPAAHATLHTQPLTLQELGACIGLSAIVFHAVELEKYLRKHLVEKRTA